MTINVTEIVAEQLQDGDYVLELDDLYQQRGWIEINAAIAGKEEAPAWSSEDKIQVEWADGIKVLYRKSQHFRIRSRGCRA